MENFSLIADNSSEATCNSSDLSGPLPLGAVAFAPIFFLEMVASLVSNTILLALVLLACVHKFNNNINIYLFSVSLTGLMGAFNTFCAFTLVVARRWVLSGVVCVVNSYTFLTANSLYLGFYLFISRDKYRMVKNSFLSRPSKKRAYLLSAVIWIASLTIVVLGSWQITQRRLNPVGKDNFLCFGVSMQCSASYTGFISSTIFVVGFWIISIIVIIVSVYNFVRILLELRKLNRLRLRFSEQSSHRDGIARINEQDRPIYTTGEERTAKSFALVFFIHLSTISISYGMSYVQIIRNFVLPPDVNENQDFYIFTTFILIAQLFTATNPVFLILSNKRLRMRVKGLFKCELNPNTGDSPAHTTTANQKKGHGTIKLPKMSLLAKFHTNSKVFPQPV